MSKASPFVRDAAVVCIVAAALVALGVGLAVIGSRVARFSAQHSIFSKCDGGTAQDVERIVKDDPDLVNARYLGRTPLNRAAACGNTGIVTVLIRHGADVNARELVTGITPLMWAVMGSKTEMMRQLIAAGSDVNLFDMYNKTALHEAVCGITPEDLSMVKLLVEAGADVNACKAGGETPLSMLEHTKADREKPSFEAIVKYLKEHGAKVNCKHTAVSTSP